MLPVGGIKAKVLAAHRAGIGRVVLPSRNERDLDEVPDEVRRAMEFVFAEDMGQVLEAALDWREGSEGDAPTLGEPPRADRPAAGPAGAGSPTR